MNTLREALQDYLVLRRGLGFKMHDAGLHCRGSSSFMEERQAEHITAQLALEWAQQSKGAACGVGTASWLRARLRALPQRQRRAHRDAAAGLLPHRSTRARPYLYTEQECNGCWMRHCSCRRHGRRRHCGHGCSIVFSACSASRGCGSPRHSICSLATSISIRPCSRFAPPSLGDPAWCPSIRPHARCSPTTFSVANSSWAARLAYVFVSNRGNRLDGGRVHRTFYALSRQTGLRGRREPRATAARLPASLCRQTSALVCVWRGRRTPTAGAVHLPWSRSCRRHLLVSERLARADGAGDGAPGAALGRSI